MLNAPRWRQLQKGKGPLGCKLRGLWAPEWLEGDLPMSDPTLVPLSGACCQFQFCKSGHRRCNCLGRGLKYQQDPKGVGTEVDDEDEDDAARL
eukprot:10752490-Alexandrium_andersonii.AAC.1